MVFNSVAFFVFIVAFLVVYFNLKGRMRIWWCLLGSYFFYGWWDWRFLSLIAISTMIDYLLGLKLDQTDDSMKRKRLLGLSMVMNLGFLGVFKYFNFFADSFGDVLLSMGLEPSWNTLHIILPVGISFYTFQSMSYTIDVYQRKIPVEKDLLRFSTFIAFFPQLVAGPIVRASDFLPQFKRDIKWDWNRFHSGTAQFLWGMFKKVAVADSLAPFVDHAFFDPVSNSSMHLLIGVIFYAFQIYCDFSGYSDMAIGLARIMGFDFPENFRTPYFSKNFSEFWSRWHISLSSWLRDYLYIPLGGNRGGSFGSWFFMLFFMAIPVVLMGSVWLGIAFVIISLATWAYAQRNPAFKLQTFIYLNLMVTMLLGGLWHGASWVFVFWGFLHGFYQVVQRFVGPYFGKFMRWIQMPSWARDGVNMAIVFFFTCFAWIFFRSPDFHIATEVIRGIASFENFDFANVTNKFWVARGALLIAMLLAVEIAHARLDYKALVLERPVFRIASFAVIIWVISFLGTFGSNAFIYFQF
ncbi:MAG: MBOAT family protein [Saprospiraceae bacterium]|nr:MBOAT family protein [Saprospiraceae bacterium]